MGLFSSIGGIAGSAIGSAIPGVGTAIGGAIGGGLGGMLDGDGRPSGAPGSSMFGGPQYTYQQYEREKVLPDYLQQPYEDTVGAVMAAGQEPFKPYEYQFRPELFAPDELRAQELYRELPGRYSPYVQGGLDVVGEAQRMALQGPNQQLLQGYMNPFIENVLDVQKRRSLEDFQRGLRDVRSRAGQVGSFGGSRFGIQEAQMYDDYGLRTDQLESQMLMAGYDRALAGLERGLDRGMVGATAGLQGLQGVDVGAIDALQASGQRQYARDYGEFIREISDPMLKAGFLAQNIQPLAATVVGERGTSLGYTSPNLGAIGEGLAFGSGLKGMGGLSGIGLGGVGDILGNLGGAAFGANTGIAAGLDPSQILRMAKGSAQGMYGPGFNEGGSVDPFDVYLDAASSGAGFVNPTGFSAWPDAPLGLGSAGVAGDDTPAGGLLGVLEAAKNKKEEAAKAETKGSEETEGKTTPGPESDKGPLDLLQDLLGTYNEGGEVKARKKEEAQLYTDMIEDMDYDGIAKELNETLPAEYQLNGDDVHNMLRVYREPGPIVPPKYPPVPPRKPVQMYNEGTPPGGAKVDREEDEKSKLDTALDVLSTSLMLYPAAGIVGGLGKAAWKNKRMLMEGAKKGVGLALGGPKRRMAASGLAGLGLANRKNMFQGEPLTEEDKKQEQGLQAVEEESSKKTGKDGREILSLPGGQFPTRAEMRDVLGKSLVGVSEKENNHRAAWAAFGSKLTEGGGLMYAFPRASHEFTKTLAAQETAKFNKQAKLLELENDMIQKETNRETARIAAQVALAKLAYLPKELEIEEMKAMSGGKSRSPGQERKDHSIALINELIAEKMGAGKRVEPELLDVLRNTQGYGVNEKP